MEVFFTKMHGTGNDFLVIDEFEEAVIPEVDKPGFVAKYCRRHFGVGADGAIFIQRSDKADARFVFYNPDGSRAEMCGNGIRCFAKYVYEKGLVPKERMTAETLSGTRSMELAVYGGVVEKVKVDMGIAGVEYIEKEINVDGKSYFISSISMGNPHAVLFVNDLDSADVVGAGRKIRNCLDAFPKGTNVHFVQKRQENEFSIRSYERGVEDETLACGTGICASAVAAALSRKAEAGKPIVFHARGGDVLVELTPDFMETKRVYMTGPAEEVYSGAIRI